VENGEVARPGSDFYAPAFAAALGVPVSELFGSDHEPAAVTVATKFGVTSNQFVPVFVGTDVVDRLREDKRFKPAPEFGWVRAWRHDLPRANGAGTAYLLEWGVIVFHLVEALRLPSLASLATWRKRAHDHVLSEVNGILCELLGNPAAPAPEYVLSAYWVDEPSWSGEDLVTAARLMCVPSVMLDRRLEDEDLLMAKAEVAERSHFRTGFEHPEVVEFGVPGVAIGCASWSGVVYLPLAGDRALSMDELASFEVIVQGLWCYSTVVLSAVEAGEDVSLPEPYGWRFLRGCRSRLTAARPTETGQVRMMRDAVLSTSRLVERLSEAQAILRDQD